MEAIIAIIILTDALSGICGGLALLSRKTNHTSDSKRQDDSALDSILSSVEYYKQESPPVTIYERDIPEIEASLKPMVREELTDCPVCKLVFSKSLFAEHQIQSGHSDKPTEVSLKPGSPFEIDEEELGDGVYSFKLKSGEKLPLWTNSERPISVEPQSDGTLLFWYSRKKGIHRIR